MCIASDCGLDIKTWSDLISRHEKGERKRALHLRGSEIKIIKKNPVVHLYVCKKSVQACQMQSFMNVIVVLLDVSIW